jgi:hypothetical protein
MTCDLVVGEGDLPTTQWAMTHARDAASALLEDARARRTDADRRIGRDERTSTCHRMRAHASARGSCWASTDTSVTIDEWLCLHLYVWMTTISRVRR